MSTVSSHKGRVLRVNQILLGDKIVQCYPDNDGNLWYYHPNTGKATKVKEA